MYKFQNILFFYGLIALPIFLSLFFIYKLNKKKKLKLLGDLTLINYLTPYISKRKQTIKVILFCLAFASLIIAMCNLQTGSKLTEVKREGADIIVCLDVSNSMLAQDLSPNRLTRAKYALEKMIDNLQGDRLGLVVFAGEAYVQLPITTDYSAAKLFLQSINPGIVPVQGTNLAAAIEKASESFSSDEGKNRAIIIISDGEDHEPEAIEKAKEAYDKGIMINTIGVGSLNGVPIPLVEDGVIKGYRKDKSGQTVVTKLNPAALKEIAAAANGVYVQASQADIGLSAVFDKISQLEKSQIENKMYTDYEDQFQWFLALSLLLFLIEFLISERVSEWLKKLNLFGQKNITTILLIAISFISNAQNDSKLIYEGNKHYYDSSYTVAELRYKESLKENPMNAKAKYNLGNTQYKIANALKKSKPDPSLKSKITPDSMANMLLDEAANNYAQVANAISNKDTLHQIWHNIGNCYLQQKKYEEAINAYKKSLKLNPKDEETRYNLAYALKNRPPKQKNGGGGQNNQQQNKKEEDKENKDQKQNNAQPQQGQMNKEQAEQLLKALMHKEQKLQNKRKQKQEDALKAKPEKDW
ncbi:MAG: VWA domain-containing protein [Bacteroidetes bacterium]|nr:VWA domain-containing protein [Bacteroidota bacterium]